MTSHSSPFGVKKASQETTPFCIPAEKRQKTDDGEAVWAAFEACKNKEVGIQEAALLYGVHKRKLRSKLKFFKIEAIDKQYRVFVLTVFPAEAEIEVAAYLQELISSHVYMTNIEVRRLGYELLREKYKVSCLPEDKNCILGERWYRSLMEKYPHLNLTLTDAKAMGDLNNFFNSLENFVKVFRIDATTIFYVDEVDLKIRVCNDEDDKLCSNEDSVLADCRAIVCTSPVGMFVPPIFLKLPDRVDSTIRVDIYDLDVEENADEEEDEDEDQNMTGNDGTEFGSDYEVDTDIRLDNTNKDQDCQAPTKTITNKSRRTRRTTKGTNSDSDSSKVRQMKRTTKVTKTVSKNSDGGGKQVTDNSNLRRSARIREKTKLVSEKNSGSEDKSEVRESRKIKTDVESISESSGSIRERIADDLKVKRPKLADKDTESISRSIASIQERIAGHLENKSQSKCEKDDKELGENLRRDLGKSEEELVAKSDVDLKPVTPELFYSWFEKFLAHVTQTVKRRKILLLLCEPSFVKYFRTLALAREYGVVFLVMPPRSVDRKYPLDGITTAMKRNLTMETKLWLENHHNLCSDGVPLFDLFKKVHDDTVNPFIAKNGFVYSGLWPIDRSVLQSPVVGDESQCLQKNSSSIAAADTSLHPYSGPESFSSTPKISRETDFEKLCRICMKKTKLTNSLFKSPPSTELNHLGKRMAELANVPIRSDDGLPSRLCRVCNVKLKDAIKMRDMTVESHRKQVKLLEAINRVLYSAEEQEDKGLTLILQEFSRSRYTKMIGKVLSKTFDINSVCRVCLNEKPRLTNIYKAQDGVTNSGETCQKIRLVSHRQICIQDGLSAFICPHCQASIDETYEFIGKILRSNSRFREIMPKTSVSS